MLTHPFTYTKPTEAPSNFADLERQLADLHRDVEQLYMLIGKESQEKPVPEETSAVTSADLKPTGVIPGQYSFPTFQVGEDGRITQAFSNPAPSVNLQPSGVAAGTYAFATITVDAYGRVTAAAQGSQAIPTVGFLGTLNVPVFNNGGNARGTGAVDWQQSRSAATQVASGNYSAILGGQNNTASGAYSSVLCGLRNSSGGDYSFAVGIDNSASGEGSCAIGDGNTVYGDDSVAIGLDNNITENSCAFGYNNNGYLGTYNYYISNVYFFGAGNSFTYNANVNLGTSSEAIVAVGRLNALHVESAGTFGGIYVLGNDNTAYGGQTYGLTCVGTSNEIRGQGTVIGQDNNLAAYSGYTTDYYRYAFGLENTIGSASYNATGMAVGFYNTISRSSATQNKHLAVGHSVAIYDSSGTARMLFGINIGGSNDNDSKPATLAGSGAGIACMGNDFGIRCDDLYINAINAYNGNVTVRNAAGTGTTTLTFTHGILTSVA